MPRKVICLTVAIAALLAPAAALAYNHTVVPFKTVAGVPLKLTPAQVTKRLGKPSHVIRVSGKVAEYDYGSRHLSVQFDNSQKQDRSVFVGVNGGDSAPFTASISELPVTTLRHGFGHMLKCETGICTLYKGAPGSVNSYRTDFAIFEGKVSAIDIQYVFKDF